MVNQNIDLNEFHMYVNEYVNISSKFSCSNSETKNNAAGVLNNSIDKKRNNWLHQGIKTK